MRLEMEVILVKWKGLADLEELALEGRKGGTSQDFSQIVPAHKGDLNNVTCYYCSGRKEAGMKVD